MATLEERINRRILDRLTQVRLERGMEKQDIAEMLSLTAGGYSPYESGVRPYTIAQVFTLARALGKPVEYFLGLDSDLTEDEREALFLYRLSPQKALAIQVLRALATAPGVQAQSQ